MKFDRPATPNPIDRGRVVGRPLDRIDGLLKTTGSARYADEHRAPQDLPAAPAFGWVVGAGIAHGRLRALRLEAAERMPGVLAIVTAQNAGPLGQGRHNTAHLLGGPEIQHYHQALALVVAQTLEQAREAAARVEVDCAPTPGRFDLAAAQAGATRPEHMVGGEPDSAVGDFEAAFAAAPVRVDARYSTPDESHAMMEPHASTAWWEGDRLTLWTSTQMVDWQREDLAATLNIPRDSVRVRSPFVGGGFGGKLFLRADALLAALGARAAGRPVKVALPRALLANNTTHRPATIQRLRLGATPDGRITAIAHQSWSGDLPGGKPDSAVHQTRMLYAGANRMTATRLAVLDLPEANSMRAPGEATGHLALEAAMDELAHALGLDPVALRIMNDTDHVPDAAPKGGDDPQAGRSSGRPPGLPFSQRQLVQCLTEGARVFGWDRRAAQPAQRREGRWWVGLGVAAAYRGAPTTRSAARVRLAPDGSLVVETDMTDIGTGSYTILGQTAAEMLGLPLQAVQVRLGDSDFPVSCGSGGQFGGACSTAGLYAACVRLREAIARVAGMDPDRARFEDGCVREGGRSLGLRELAAEHALVGEDSMDYGDLAQQAQSSTFGAHFVEVGVDAFTAEVRVRRMLAVCAAGRILNPKTARSQVIGAMTMGVGSALMEALAVDRRLGFFVNHDLASYEVPVHADIPHQEVIFLDGLDPMATPMQAKGVAELGICGVGAAVANAVWHATGVRVRDYPLTVDKLLAQLPR